MYTLLSIPLYERACAVVTPCAWAALPVSWGGRTSNRVCGGCVVRRVLRDGPAYALHAAAWGAEEI